MEQQIIDYINATIRPMTKADGGDMECTHIENDTVYLTAYGDCAVCQSCGDDIKWWITKKLKSKFNVTYSIEITKKIPYFE